MAIMFQRGRVWWGRVNVRGRDLRTSLKTHHEAIAKERFRAWALEVGSQSHEQAMRGHLGPMSSNPGNPDGVIYAIGYGDKVKVGWARTSARDRLKALQIGCPEDLVLMGQRQGTVADERVLHRRFAQWRIRGEWFRLEGDVADWISSHAIGR